MAGRRIAVLPSFASAVRELPELQDAIAEAIRRFVHRTNEHALRVEKLRGLKGVWSFRIDRSNRVFFDQAKDPEGKTVNRLFHAGPHDEYRTVARKRPEASKPVNKKRQHARQREGR